MLGLHDSASCCYSDSNELFRLHYRFPWAYVDSSQTISSHWIFIYLFFSFFSHFLSFKAFLQKYIIMWMTYWHFLRVYDSNKTSTVTVSCLDIVIRISSVPERWRGMVVLASKKESQRQVHRWRKTPPEHYLVTAVQEKKIYRIFSVCGMAWEELRTLTSRVIFLTTLLANRGLDSFWKSKRLNFSYLFSTICLSQINTFHGNSVSLCTEQLQFPLLYSIFPL